MDNDDTGMDTDTESLFGDDTGVIDDMDTDASDTGSEIGDFRPEDDFLTITPSVARNFTETPTLDNPVVNTLIEEETDTQVSYNWDIRQHQVSAKVQCNNMDPMTLEPYDESQSDIISIKMFDRAVGKFSQGVCTTVYELGRSLDTDFDIASTKTPMNVMSLWSHTSDPSGYGGHPVYKYIVKLPVNNIFVTAKSLVKMLQSKGPTVLYALPLFEDRKRRVGNVAGVFGVGMNHGQIPGYKVYKIYTKSELMSVTDIGPDSDEFYDHEWISLCNTFAELMHKTSPVSAGQPTSGDIILLDNPTGRQENAIMEYLLSNGVIGMESPLSMMSLQRIIGIRGKLVVYSCGERTSRVPLVKDTTGEIRATLGDRLYNELAVSLSWSSVYIVSLLDNIVSLHVADSDIQNLVTVNAATSITNSPKLYHVHQYFTKEFQAGTDIKIKSNYNVNIIYIKQTTGDTTVNASIELDDLENAKDVHISGAFDVNVSGVYDYSAMHVDTD